MSNILGSSFGKPTIESVAIPDVKKRRVPNKFYVYKIVVEWSNTQTVTVYRRYSNFFDFWCKLKEQHSLLLAKSYTYQESNPTLPDMPGKIYLGRSQVHQVAEKRRKKLQEFCQHLIKMPTELSQSSIVYGFFSLWPDDTISGQQVRRHTASGRNVIKPDFTSSVKIMSPSDKEVHPLLSENSGLLRGLEQSLPTRKPRSVTIDTADLMDENEDHYPQYRVIQDYSRLDSQQVNLKDGQIVTVVEKHDTGWWMIEVGEEQGYAPASVLVPVDENESESSVEDTIEDSDEYTVLEDYSPCDDDELPLAKGDTVQIVAVVLDGWWKMKKGDKIGYAPASILRRKGMDEVTKTLTRESQMFLNDTTLLRSSTRFPPRHSFSKHSFLKKLRRHTDIDKKPHGKKVSPATPPLNPGANLEGLPPGIQYRYEMCQPGERQSVPNSYEVFRPDEVLDEDPEGIYKVPRNISVNFNASNNQSGDGDGGNPDEGGINIYNVVVSPPIVANVDSIYSEIPELTPGDDPGVSPSVVGSNRELPVVKEVPEDTRTPYFDHLKPRKGLGSIGSWDELQKREYPAIDPELLKPSQTSGTKAGETGAGEGKPHVRPPPRIPRATTVSESNIKSAAGPTPKKPPPPTRPKPPTSRLTAAAKEPNLDGSKTPSNEVSDKPDLPPVSPSDNTPQSDPSTPSGVAPSSNPSLAKQHSLDSVLSAMTSDSPTKPHRPPPRKPAPYKKELSPFGKMGTEATDGATHQKSEELSSTTSRERMSKRPLPSTPQSDTDLNDRASPVFGAIHRSDSSLQNRPLPDVPKVSEANPQAQPLQPPQRKPRFPHVVRESAETVPARPEDMSNEPFDEYLFLNSKERKLSRDDEYIEVDEHEAFQLPVVFEERKVMAVRQMTPSEQGSEGGKVSPHPPHQKEQNGKLSPPVPHVLSTETPDISIESIVSQNIEEMSPPNHPPQEHPLPPTPDDDDDEDDDHAKAMNFVKVDPQFVDYENVTLDILNMDQLRDPDLYENVSAPPSEYANVHYSPNRRPGVDNLGIFIATGTSDASDKCISVNTGEEGIKLAESKDWWYMRVGCEEGWTPKDIWEPTEETRILLSQTTSLSKKKSFNTADGVKPKTAPPKPVRGLDKIKEDEDPVAPPLPSRNIIESPSNQPSNQPANQQKGNLQQRPLPKIPRSSQSESSSGQPGGAGSGQYVCDTELPLDLQPWFYSTMDRPESEKLLTQPSIRNREFIVRERKNKAGYYALSVRHHYSVRHFNIDPQSESDMFVIGNKTFKTLPEIILYYQKHSLFNEGSNNLPVSLSCPAKLTRQRAATSFR